MHAHRLEHGCGFNCALPPPRVQPSTRGGLLAAGLSLPMGLAVNFKISSSTLCPQSADPRPQSHLCLGSVTNADPWALP